MATARRLYLERSWPAAYAVDKFGSSALMWAASYGRVEAARWLVEEAHAYAAAATSLT